MNFKNYTESVESEAEYRELARLGRKLKIPIPECYLGIKLYDGNGQLIREETQRSHTWNRNYYVAQWATMGLGWQDGSTLGAGTLGMKNTGGTGCGVSGVTVLVGVGGGTNLYYYSANCYGNAPAGTVHGIVVGGSDTAESFEHYGMQTAIAHGTSSGQLYYHAVPYPVQSYDSGSKTWQTTHHRYFSNQSGGGVDVKETGLYWYICYGTSQTRGAFMINRDKLASTITVPNLGQIGVIYTVSMTFPE